MVTNPLDYVEPLGKAGASGFTFHVEVSKGRLCGLGFSYCFVSFWFVLLFLLQTICLIYLFDFIWVENWQELVQRIKLKGMKPGVALKPGTPVEEVYPLV